MAYGPVNIPGGVSPDELKPLEAIAAETKETAQAASDKIGTTADTGGSTTAGTVMGKLNKLLADLATHMGRWTAARAGYIDTIKGSTDTIKSDAAAAKSNTATNNTASSTGTLSQKISYIINQMASGSAKMGAVKSIQRGTGTITKGTNTANITINSVNPDKCAVLLDGRLDGQSSAMYYMFTVSSLSKDNLVVKVHTTNSTSFSYEFSWQIIEFY